MILGHTLALTLRTLVGARSEWLGCRPEGAATRLYFANHTSHLDAPVLWSALPYPQRRSTRPVAARDYWGNPGLRHWFANTALRALLIDRERSNLDSDPLDPLSSALNNGDSLILFPEGTRGDTHLPGPFRSGLYHLAYRHPDVELIPVYLQNLYRSMPKGATIPVPLTCTVRFGAPFLRVSGEDKNTFLERARMAIEALV